jgi:ribosome-associated protein
LDDLKITDAIVVPADELHWSFSPAGGPGGQHANRSSTRAELRFSIVESRAFDDATRKRLVERLSADALVITSDESRSQWRNRQAARARLAESLRAALQPDPPERKPTRPSRKARLRRREEKRRRSLGKRLRRPPTLDD